MISGGEILTLALLYSIGKKTGTSLSEITENMPQLIELIKSIEARMPSPNLPTMPKYYEVYPIDLSTARDKEAIIITGDNLLVQDINGSLTVRINQPDYDALDLMKIRQIKTPFDALYLTNEAQSGCSATLIVGRGAFFETIVSEAGTPQLIKPETAISLLNKIVGTASYQDIVKWVVSPGKVGVLSKVEMASDSYSITEFRLVVNDIEVWTDMELPSSLTLSFPDILIREGKTTLVQGRTNGIEKVIWADITGKERPA